MNNKLYKRAEFLSKFLEYHGLHWKVDIINYYYASCKFTLAYKDKISTAGMHIDCDAAKLSFTNIDNLTDYKFKLSINLFIYFKAYYNVLDPEQCKLASHLTHCIKYINPRAIDIDAYENIDFEHLIQCMILDGIPLDKFPSIEEVL